MPPRTRELQRRCLSCGLGALGNQYEILPTGSDRICVTCRRHQSRLFPTTTASAIDTDSGQSMTSAYTPLKKVSQS